MFRQLKTNEVALLLHGLRSMWVQGEALAHARLTVMLERELAARGVRLEHPDSSLIDEKPDSQV